MKSYQEYRNQSTRAKVIAWLMDLLVNPFYRLFSALFSRPSVPDEKIKSILLVRLDHLGDLLMATPAIAALRKRYPHARIDLLAGRRAEGVFMGNDDIDAIIPFEAVWYDPRRGGDIWPIDVVSTILRLRKGKYDAAVDMRGDFRVIFLFLWLGGARKRIGFRNLGLDFLLTDAVDYDNEKDFIEINFDSLSVFCIDRKSRTTKFFVSEDDREYARALLVKRGTKEEDILVGINPTTNRIEQRWDERRFAEVADRLTKQFGVKAILVAAAEDAGIVEWMKGRMESAFLDLSGMTTLGQLGALMERFHLYIANDSGTMHLAVALGVPVIGIFGTSDVRRSWPYGSASPLQRAISADVDCSRPCYAKDCEDRQCFDLITVDEVYRAASEILTLKMNIGLSGNS